MNLDRLREGAPHERTRLFGFSIFTAAAVVFLLLAGAAVKTTESGLAFPDWPLSDGTLMPDMSQRDNFFEHGHRMIATGVGLLTIVLAVWTWMRDPRPAIRRLAWIALALVVVQGVFGGVTVLLGLQVWSSATHATLAQAFFLVVVFLALAFSRGWNTAAPLAAPGSRLPALATAATLAIFVQLILGAVTRHLEGALAIPTVPPAFLFPPPAFANGAVVAHYAHRVGAVMVTFLVVAAALAALRTAKGRRDFVVPAVLMMVLVAVQFALGIMVVLSLRHLHVTNTHVVTGALLFAASFVLTARSWRFIAHARAAAAPRASRPDLRPGKVPA